MAELKDQIEEMASSVRALDQSAFKDGVSNHYIEIEWSREHDEVRIYGNRAGLVHVARRILEVASSDSNSAHFCFDTAGLVDVCDIPIVVALKLAPWQATD